MSLAISHLKSEMPDVLHGTLFAVPQSALSIPHSALIQPVANVAEYLKTRKPSPRYEDEMALYITLPDRLRAEVDALQRAYAHIKGLLKSGLSVAKASAITLANFRTWHWNLNTFRAKFDAWSKAKDWTVLVNRSKAGAAWQETDLGLPDEFLIFCAARIGKFKRNDARKQALRSILWEWHKGVTMEGVPQLIPGYGFKTDWLKRHPDAKRADVPDGWHYSNIMRQIKARGLLSEAARGLLLQGSALAKESLPEVLGDTKYLRFMEEVQFDDVKTDFRIFNRATGKAEDLWLLVARDRATRMLLGFGMRPARVREDGTQEHLKLQDMKQLCGWLLERYGLPPYEMTWKIERGTATLSAGSAAALQEMMPGRIKVSYSSMIGGTSPEGYFERRIGNSKGKASLESHNRGMHLIGAGIAGQTGPAYGQRPADLAAREKECQEIALLSEFLPEHLRGQLGFSLLDIGQARAALFQIFTIQNHRDDHTMEGFETVIEWWDGASWQPQNTAPAEARIRRRMEMPIERAARLCAGVKFDRVSPDIITTFYEHTQRLERVEPSGEIHFHFEGTLLKFASPDGNHLPEGTKVLCYCHPDDPTYLHLTDGKGAIIGTWLQRAKVKHGDHAALSQAMEYQARAMKTARETADALAAPQRAELDSMRAKNAELLKLNEFIDVAVSPISEIPHSTIRTPHSPVAAGLASVGKQRVKKVNAERDRVNNLRRFDGDAAELAGADFEAPAQSSDDDFSAENLL